MKQVWGVNRIDNYKKSAGVPKKYILKHITDAHSSLTWKISIIL